MELRAAITPDLRTAEKYYSEVIDAILTYTAFCDEYGDEDATGYKNLVHRLHRLTGKDMSRFNLSEWWEEEGAEVLAFKISLPDPLTVPDLSREELKEIVDRIKITAPPPTDEDSFPARFHYYLADYYHRFLALNCKQYHIRLFQRNKDKAGQYVEYSADEIVEKIWDDRSAAK